MAAPDTHDTILDLERTETAEWAATEPDDPPTAAELADDPLEPITITEPGVYRFRWNGDRIIAEKQQPK